MDATELLRFLSDYNVEPPLIVEFTSEQLRAG
jgi:hypothetical protein